jgi:hypothetical protein
MMVEPAHFVAAMSQHWTNALGNVISPALQAVWRQMADAFNAQIADADNTNAEHWRVLQPATGTGKTQGLAVYASMLPDADHPGVLIVVRLMSQADDVAANVNRLAGRDIARSYHTENKADAGKLSDWPVLVITHRAYEIGLDAVNKGQPNTSNWNRYHEWRNGSRKLIVIDEALDIIEEAQIDIDRMRRTLGAIPWKLEEEFPLEFKAMRILLEWLMTAARSKLSDQEALLTGGPTLPDTLDLSPLRRRIKDTYVGGANRWKKGSERELKLRADIDAALKDIQAVLSWWAWYAQVKNDPTVNTAKLIVPDNINGAVIMDATASANLVYRLFDKAMVLPVPAQSRTYRNVTLHVSIGHAVGKNTLHRNAEKATTTLAENLKATLPADRKVFVVCHQLVEPFMRQHSTGFAAFDTGHWQALDGRNDWQHHDTVAIFGLPYRDAAWSANTFMALQGVKDTEWLNADGNRPFRGYADIRKALAVGQLVTDVVQAINRVRCRRVTDAQGNCLPVDVYVLLPNDQTGRELLEGVQREMPGIVVETWKYAQTNKRGRRSQHEAGLLSFASNGMEPGEWSMTEVRNYLSIPFKTWERIRPKLTDPNSELSTALAQKGVTYRPGIGGRGNKAVLVKR